MPASLSTTTLCLSLGLAAALAAATVLSTPAHGQLRRSSNDSSGMTMMIGSSKARLCYEHALERSRSATAIENCNAAIAGRLSERDEVATLVNRAIVRAERNDLSGALEDLDAAAGLRPETAEIHMNYGDVYSRLARWDEADAAFTRALDLGFQTPQQAYFGRAIAREEIGDLYGAYDDYSTASRLAPNWLRPKRELERFVVGSGAAG